LHAFVNPVRSTNCELVMPALIQKELLSEHAVVVLGAACRGSVVLSPSMDLLSAALSPPSDPVVALAIAGP